MQGDFRIDEWLVQPRVNCVEKDGRVWRLEPKIMQVLVELASHPNEVLTKTTLLANVWQNTFVGEDALVRCISEIRNVFGDAPKSSRIIQTIPKTGYRLIATVSTSIGSPPEPLLLEKNETRSPDVLHRPSTVEKALPSISTEVGEEQTSPGVFSSALTGLLPVPQSAASSSTFAVEGGSSILSRPPARYHRAFSYRRVSLAVAAALLVALLACMGLHNLVMSTRHSAVDWFWDPVFNGGESVLVCIADQLQSSQISLRDAADPKRMVPVNVTFATVALDDMRPIMRVDGVIQSHVIPHTVKAEALTSLDDLKSGPAVLIGAFDNAWTLRLTSALRFHFWNSADMSQLGIVDSANPGQTDWVVDRTVRGVDSTYRDYAMVARFTDVNTGKLVVIIGGVRSAGTIAAGEYVSDPHGLDQLRRTSRDKQGKNNVAVVLSTQVIDGEPGFPKVEAVHFW